MNIKQWLQAEYLPLSLIALMTLTRFHHFGDVLHLPDASLAVFFLAGFYRKKAFLGFLLALAALIDYVAIANGTSGWCVSPAYVFLIPTYAVMWLAGRYAATLKAGHLSKQATAVDLLTLTASAGLLAVAASIAFVISNGGFYLFSGRYDAMPLADYLARTAHYYPYYVGAALIYAFAGYAAVKLIRSLPEPRSSHKSV